jgi:hypothetical protein
VSGGVLIPADKKAKPAEVRQIIKAVRRTFSSRLSDHR